MHSISVTSFRPNKNRSDQKRSNFVFATALQFDRGPCIDRGIRRDDDGLLSGLSCNSKLGTLKFAGASFDKPIVDPNTSVALNLANLNFTCALFDPFDSIFDLTIYFAKPGTTTVNVDADVKGLVTFWPASSISL